MKRSLGLIILIITNISILASCNNKTRIERFAKSSVYFIDSQNGNDKNDGRSESSAWLTLTKIENLLLIPGDSIRFKRGSSFTGPLHINKSGNSGHYIILTDYGDSRSPAPAFTNPVFDTQKGNFGNCIRLNGSFIVVENLYCHNTVAELSGNFGGFTTMWELGAIYIDKGAEHCIVRNNELFDCGVGIKSYGQYAVIQDNYIHDCNRVLKEWGWGPIGIWLGADYQEVCYNRIFNYSVVDSRITWGADSYGGGADGGAIEIDDARVSKSHISIHHNYTRDCQGFLEVTWTDVLQNPAYTGFEIHHNVSDDFQQFIAMWRGADCKIDNNTIIRRKKNVNDWGVFNITQNNARNYIRNNIIVVENDIVIFNVGKNGTAQPNNIIENNLYYQASGALNTGKEGPGKSPVYGNPLFVNYSTGNKADDFSILTGSPAVNKGQNLGFIRDFAGTAIPQEAVADIGAFEFKK